MILGPQTYGIVIVYKEEEENLFLVLQNNDAEGSWSFPKGHVEGIETPKETALRELEEETKIEEVDFLDVPFIHEEYDRVGRDGDKYHKKNDYFIGFVKDKKVVKQDEEIYTYKWVTFKEAMDIFTYESRKKVLKEAQKYLEDMVK